MQSLFTVWTTLSIHSPNRIALIPSVERRRCFFRVRIMRIIGQVHVMNQKLFITLAISLTIRNLYGWSTSQWAGTKLRSVDHAVHDTFSSFQAVVCRWFSYTVYAETRNRRERDHRPLWHRRKRKLVFLHGQFSLVWSAYG